MWRTIACITIASLMLFTIPNQARAQFLSNLFGTGGAEEDGALQSAEFLSPIILQLGRDAFAQAQRLRSMNGVSAWNIASDLNPVNGPNDFTPCVNASQGGGLPNILAQIPSYSFPAGVLSAWLLNNRAIYHERYDLRYINTEMTNARYSSNYPTRATFICPVLNENVGKLAPSSQIGSLHNGLSIPIGKRSFLKWSYKNRYETPIAGKGNVKVFAGTMVYQMDSLIPLISFSGEGTASIKLILNPDNGKWVVNSWERHDPPLTLKTNPLEQSAAAQNMSQLQTPADTQGSSSKEAGRVLDPKRKMAWDCFQGECYDQYVQSIRKDAAGNLIAQTRTHFYCAPKYNCNAAPGDPDDLGECKVRCSSPGGFIQCKRSSDKEFGSSIPEPERDPPHATQSAKQLWTNICALAPRN